MDLHSGGSGCYCQQRAVDSAFDLSSPLSLSLLSLPLTLFQPLNSCIIFNQQNAVSPSTAWAFPN